METFILKLAVAVIPLILLITSVITISSISHWYVRHPLAWHRKRRHLLRTMAHGVLLR
jgi:hypothetical protein